MLGKSRHGAKDSGVVRAVKLQPVGLGPATCHKPSGLVRNRVGIVVIGVAGVDPTLDEFDDELHFALAVTGK